jgi:hypothetical protein
MRAVRPLLLASCLFACGSPTSGSPTPIPPGEGLPPSTSPGPSSGCYQDPPISCPLGWSVGCENGVRYCYDSNPVHDGGIGVTDGEIIDESYHGGEYDVYAPDTSSPDAELPDAELPDAEFPGTVQCGEVPCSTQAYFCMETPIGGPTTFACVDYPPQCGPEPSCQCILSVLPGCDCTDEGSGALVVQCPTGTMP